MKRNLGEVVKSDGGLIGLAGPKSDRGPIGLAGQRGLREGSDI